MGQPAPVYVRVVHEFRAGALAARSARLDPPPHHARVHRFVHAAALPFTVLRVLLRDRAARRAYFEILAIELAFAIPLAIACAASSDAVGDVFSSHGWRASLEGVVTVLATMYGALAVIEWCVIALAHEHHDALAVTAAQLTGAPYQALPGPPRVRLNSAWLRTKAKRKLRALVLIACGIPAVVWTLGIPGIGDWVYGVLTSVWTAYWLSVFALAGTFLAWEGEPTAPDAWFLRALDGVGRVPLIGIPFRIYARLCRRITRSVRAACAAFEEAPWEAAGLALSRLIGGVPIVYLALRPVFGVAATHALAGSRHVRQQQLTSGEPPGPRVTSSDPPAPRVTSSDPPSSPRGR